jgi:small subunit ribosomal protein S16
MVKLRMTRLGRHKDPFYRIVAVDSKQKRDGEYIELLGTFEPFSGKVEIKEESVIKWLSNGAQPSPTVRTILKNKGIYKKFLDSKK